MFRLIILYIILGFILMGLSPAWGEDTNLAEPELRLYEIVNEARVKPLEMVAAMGMDPQYVLDSLPELREILTNGLPPLYYSQNLHRSARQHSDDMLAQDYFDRVSPDGKTPDERIREAGYVPRVSGESIGILGFVNFVKSSDAVYRIFENMYKEELDPQRTERRNILAPDIEEVGVGFGTGRMTLGGNRFNVYVATCDFGSSEVSSMEMELLQMINQFRDNPLAVAAAFGMDTEKIWADLPELHDLLTNGIPPLMFNSSLYLAASAHAQDMLMNDYYSDISPDGRTMEERSVEYGYAPVVTAETMRMLVTTDYVSPKEGAKMHFQRLLQRELVPGSEERAMLNPDLREAGISFVTMTPDMWAESYSSLYSDYYTLLMVADFGTSITSQNRQYLQVQVYDDQDGDNLPDFGEGVSGVPISVKGDDETVFSFSNYVGGFAVALQAGDYQVISSPNKKYVDQRVEINAENELVTFEIND